MSKVDKVLRVVWSNHSPKRYIPRATGDGYAWQVWDQLQDRFLTKDEVSKIDPREVMGTA